MIKRAGGKSGFNAKLGGVMYKTGDHENLGNRGYYWSSTSMATFQGSGEYHLFTGSTLYVNAMPKEAGMYCRCVKNIK